MIPELNLRKELTEIKRTALCRGHSRCQGPEMHVSSGALWWRQMVMAGGRARQAVDRQAGAGHGGLTGHGGESGVEVEYTRGF